MAEITTTYETALALENAGFPQPFPAFGQRWYFPVTNELFLVTFVYSNGKVDYCMEGSQVVMFEDIPESSIFAPTATDILEQLWYKFELSFRIDEKWVIRETKSLDDFSREFSVDNTNPHESAAKAWLKMRTENAEK